MRVLVTGAGGFLGQAIVRSLRADSGVSVIAISRSSRERGALPPGESFHACLDIEQAQGWASALRGVDVVVHAAARVHVMKDHAADPAAAFHRTNVAATMNLARLAVQSGVRRFIFISSIKVNGDATAMGRPFLASDEPRPEGPYAQSKLDAEVALTAFARQSGLQLVILRPPLIYGPGVKGNFARLMGLLRSGLPLPLGAIRGNLRSYLSVGNMVSLIHLCLDHPGAAGRTFLASDGEDVSTADLLRRMACALGYRAALWRVPVALLAWTGKLTRNGETVDRLLGNLQVDIEATRAALGWSPVQSLDEGLHQLAETRT